MKPISFSVMRLPCVREWLAAILTAGLLLQPVVAVSPSPGWWTTYEAVDPYGVLDDFAPANVGQLKYIASKAAAAMNAELPEGAGPGVMAIVAPWLDDPASGTVRDDYQAVNAGQLKFVAKPFYDRLSLPYPWPAGSTGEDDDQMVNIGQVKNVFSFDLHFRRPGAVAGIPDDIYQAALSQWNDLPAKPLHSSTDDFDGDGIPNLQEYLMGTPLYDGTDIDGDRIPDAFENLHGPALSKLRFGDAVEDFDDDGVMNFEEYLLGLNPASPPGDLSDAEVLAWGLVPDAPLAHSNDALKACWDAIQAKADKDQWVTDHIGEDFLAWLSVLDANMNAIPDGLEAMRADVANGLWFLPPIWRAAPLDCDGDDLPDLWEYRYSLNLRDYRDESADMEPDTRNNEAEYTVGTNPRLKDTDGDGFDDDEEFRYGSDPIHAGEAPPLSIAIVSGGWQSVEVGGTSAPLVVQVKQGDQPRQGALVTFTVSSGGGMLYSGPSVPSTSLTLTSSSMGITSTDFQVPDAAGPVTVTAALSGASSTVTFTLTATAAVSSMWSGGGGSSAPYGSSAGRPGASPSNTPQTPGVWDKYLLKTSHKSMYAAMHTKMPAEGDETKVFEGYTYDAWKPGPSGHFFPAGDKDKTANVEKTFLEEQPFYAVMPYVHGVGSLVNLMSADYGVSDHTGPTFSPPGEQRDKGKYRSITTFEIVNSISSGSDTKFNLSFMALVYVDKQSEYAIPPDPAKIKTAGSVTFTETGVTWSANLNDFLSKMGRKLIVDPGKEGIPSKYLGSEKNAHISVQLLPVEIKDVKAPDAGDDVIIQAATQAPAATKKYTEAEVAWIEPHGGFAGTLPEMPQLEVRVPGLPASTIVEWSFECKYDRGNGKRTARNQFSDRVEIPSVQTSGDQPWRIYQDSRWTAELNFDGFFGGDAIVTMKIGSQETKFYFRIGGKNPQPASAKQFIESQPNAGPNGNLWFTYAIAKSESKVYNGGGTRYNQFLVQLPKWEQSLGRPLWGDDGGATPGGYGLIQITGDASSQLADIPREQIWDWQANARAGVTLLASKRTTAATWMTRQKNASNANGTALPSLTVLNVTFAEGSTRTMTDAVTMKLNNGASAAPSDVTDTDGAAPGFIIDPQSGGHFCYWKNAAAGTNKWALSRRNNPPGNIQSFNYVLRVCEEVE